MTQSERDNSIERYIDGTMAPDERRAFLDRLDHDQALRAALHAEALIATAIRSDRAATPGPSAASRTTFLTMLAALPEPNAPLAEATDAGTGKPTGGGIAASGVTKAIVTTMVGVAVTIGAVMMLPRRSPSPAPRPIGPPSQVVTIPAPQPQSATPDGPAADIPEQMTGEAPAATDAGTAQNSAGTRQEKTRAPRTRTSPGRETATRDGNSTARNEEKGEKEPVITDPTPARLNVNDPTISR